MKRWRAEGGTFRMAPPTVLITSVLITSAAAQRGGGFAPRPAYACYDSAADGYYAPEAGGTVADHALATSSDALLDPSFLELKLYVVTWREHVSARAETLAGGGVCPARVRRLRGIGCV